MTIRKEVREVRVGTIPSWMEYAGCMYHSYPCRGTTEYCDPVFRVRATYWKRWRRGWRNTHARGYQEQPDPTGGFG